MNTSQTKTNPVLLLILILVGILLIVSVLIFFQVKGASETKLDLSRQQELASNLLDAKLFTQAVAEYQRLLNLSGLDKKKQTNINYIIGNIYLNEMNDYENAAARFVTAKFLDPEGILAI